MSRQTGLIKLKGEIGDVSFYSSNGVDLAHLARSPSKERLLNSPEFRRTRENMNEFGGGVNAGKTFRPTIGERRMINADAKVGRLQKFADHISSAHSGTPYRPAGEQADT